ncbi:hypothetical protein MMC25_008241 [Agyrium rufum]|nr:hypothetical protein [Agyrium rufum]
MPAPVEKTRNEFDSIKDSIEAFRNGEFIVVLDSEDRENEGDLIIAAEAITTEKMAFMIRYTSGLICTPLPPSLTQKLSLPQMVPEPANTESHGTAYTVSVDASHPAVTTGISSHDRALTCRMLADPKSTAQDFRRPGHVFPLRARDGGVRERNGHTEAAVEFCRLSGRGEVGVICEIVADEEEVDVGEVNGSEEGEERRKGGKRARKAEIRGSGMMRRDGCLAFGKRWGLKVCTIDGLVKYLEERDGGGAKAMSNGGSH